MNSSGRVSCVVAANMRVLYGVSLQEGLIEAGAKPFCGTGGGAEFGTGPGMIGRLGG